MLTPALPTSAVNPVNSSFNGGSSATASGYAEPAPDGFARLLDKASKPDTERSPDKPAPASGSSGSSQAEDHSDQADASTVDVRTVPWPAGPKPIKSQHPPVTPPPGHPPVRLPPVPGDDAVSGETLDTLTLAAGPADSSTDAGLLDAAAALAAAASTPTTPTPDSASASANALLAAWTASAAADAPCGTAADGADGADRAIAAREGASASGRSAVATLASAAMPLGHASGDLRGDVRGDVRGALPGGAPVDLRTDRPGGAPGGVRGDVRNTGPHAVFDAGPDPAAGARRGGLANRTDRGPVVADAGDRTSDFEAAAAAAAIDGGGTSLASASATTPAAATQRRGSTAESAALGAERNTEQTAAQTASRTAHPTAAEAAVRAGDPLSGMTGVTGLGGVTGATAGVVENRAGALQTQNRSSGTDNGRPNTPRGVGAHAGPQAGAAPVGAAANGSARSDAEAPGIPSQAFNIDGRAAAGARQSEPADLHGGVPAASAQAAAIAALAASALTTLREAGASTRSADSERGSLAAAAAAAAGAGATGAGGVPMGGALAWVSTAAAGTTAPAAASDGRIAASPGSADFAPQLAAQISTFVRDGMQHARLELNPAEMGPLTVQIQLDGNAARVHLAAEHAGTRAALEQAMPQLAGSLREGGLTLSGGGVFEQPRQPQAQTGDGRNDNRNNGSSASDGMADGRRTGVPDAALSAVTGSTAVSGRRRAGVVDLVA